MKITIEDDNGFKCAVEKSNIEEIGDVMDLFRCALLGISFTESVIDEYWGDGK